MKNLRWWIVGLVALATAINYLDRQTFPVAVSEITKVIPINDAQYGMINSLFLLSYGTMYAVGGRILDLLGSRIGYAIMITWWSLANIFHGFVSTVSGFGLARFLLGIGEGGGFPGSAKVVSEWFPVKERSMAFGIFNTGSSLGAVVAPPLIAIIIASLDWRWAFILTGLVGIIWVLLWIKIYALPHRSKFITTQEKTFLEKSFREEADPDESVNAKTPWLSLFKYREVWGLLTIKFFTDAGWFFFIFWLPKYLNDERGLDIMEIGAYAWIPYAFAGGGSFIGGWLSSYLLKKNLSLDLSRKIPLGIGAVMLPASLFIADVSLNMAVLFFSLAMFGHQLWATLVQTLAADIFPSKVVGSVAGLMGSAGTYGAMLFSLAIGFVIERFGYSPAFIVSGLLHPVSFLLLLIMIRKISMVKLIHS